jgi:hypothetical protein
LGEYFAKEFLNLGGTMRGSFAARVVPSSSLGIPVEISKTDAAISVIPNDALCTFGILLVDNKHFVFNNATSVTKTDWLAFMIRWFGDRSHDFRRRIS